MEESKVVPMVNKPETIEDYKKQNENLTNYCNQLMQQRNELIQQLNGVRNVLNKLPWLFKVVELQNNFDATFVKNCVEEITIIMTPPEEISEVESKSEE